MSNLLGLGYAGGEDDDDDDVDESSEQAEEQSQGSPAKPSQQAEATQPVEPSSAARPPPEAGGRSVSASEQDAHESGAPELDARPAAGAGVDSADQVPAAGPHADAPERPHDPADNDATPGIPPPPGEPCRPSLQARIDLLLQQQARSGKQLISTLLNNREYRNPRFMERLVELNNVQQYGTCFAPSVFDPASLPEEDYLPQIRRRLEQQRQEKKAAREKFAGQGVGGSTGLGAPRMHPAAMPAAASAPATFLQRVSGTSGSKPPSERKRSRRWDNTQPRSPRR